MGGEVRGTDGKGWGGDVVRLWESLHHLVDPANHTEEEVKGYQQIGGQVLDVLDRLTKESAPGAALAYIQVARCLELAADGLIAPYQDPSAGHMPNWIRSQALALYQPIPELVTAAKQEAIDPGGGRDVDLPWVLKGRVLGASREDMRVFHAYGGAVKSVMEWVEVAVQSGPALKQAQLYFAEASTNWESANHLLYGFRDQAASVGTLTSLDNYLWTALAYALGAIQEQVSPGIMQKMDIDTMLEGADIHDGHLQVLRADRSGHSEVVRDIARQWRDVMRDEGPYAEHHHEHHRDWD